MYQFVSSSSSGWIAKINGLDDHYKYSRDFCSKSNSIFTLEDDGIYEFRNIILGSDTINGFFFISKNSIIPVEEDSICNYL